MYSFTKVKGVIKSIHNTALPGIHSHKKMLPPDREFPLNPKNYLTSSVLIPVFPRHDEAWILFIKRPEYNGIHSSQMALPGGKKDPGDANLYETAIRETYEEVGISKDNIESLHAISAIPIPVSNMMVYPFIGIINEEPELRINPFEVAYTVPVSVQELMHTPVVQQELYVRDTTIIAPGFQVKNEFIWGATAMIIEEFLDLIKSGND